MLEVLNTIAMVVGYSTVVITVLLWYYIVYVPNNFIHPSRERRFALLPTKVVRKSDHHKAIVWLQHYILVTGISDFYTIDDKSHPTGTKYVDNLGLLSYEL